MSHQSDLAPNYIDLTDFRGSQDAQERAAMSLTCLAAATVSDLAYCRTAEALPAAFNDRRHQRARELDAVTAVWMLPNIRINNGTDKPAIDQKTDMHAMDQGTHKPAIEMPALVLGWSDRLKVLFIGFCGTRNRDDAWADISATQTVDPDLASRFHTGFYARALLYKAPVDALAREHDVVLCGHSLGGALATIVAYTLLAHGYRDSPVRNTWTRPSITGAASPHALSVITFGAPAMMVIEDARTTAGVQLALRRNIHHIINANDMVPFVVNYAMRKAGWLFSGGQNVLRTVWPGLGPWFAAMSHMLQAWAGSHGKFAHFGCLYLLTPSTHAYQTTMVCQQITTLDALPATPIDAPVQTYHPMRHYLLCVRQTIDVLPEPAAPEYNVAGLLSTLRLPDQPQSSRIKVYDDRIVLSLVLDAPLAANIITRVSYRLNNADTVPSSYSFEQAFVHDPVTMTIEQQLRGDGTQTVPQILETLYAMRTSLTIRDCFGHTMAVSVADTDVELTELRDLGMSTTFASLRRAMIVAFADQMAHLQRIKLGETDATSQDDRRANRQAAGTLSGRARCLSSTLDALVASAVPSLVVARLPRALWLVKKLWDGDDNSQAPGPQVDATYFSHTQADIYAEEIASLIPIDVGCSTGVRAKLVAMLRDFDTASRTHLQPRQLKQEVSLQKRLSDVDRTLGRRPFARALETYGDRLYNRSPNSAAALDEARTQSQEVMDVMRVCHAIILTQLDAPFDWFVRQTDFFPAGPFAAGVAPTYYAGIWSWTRLASFAGSSTFYSALAGIGGFYIGLAVLVVTTLVVEHAIDTLHAMRARRKRIEVDYDKALTSTRQAFHLTSQPFDSIRETAIAKCLQVDLGTATEGHTILKWKNVITAGFKGMGDKSPISLYFYTIGDFWTKWLFDVARVSQLRTALNSHVYIGVEGPTEAGKSELLTMLTGAPPGVFASGSDEEHRTTEIQSWISPNRRAVFCDFPGSDDRDVELRNVARLCREMLDVVIFVVPYAASRAAGRVPILDEISAFIDARTLDMRPFLILVSKVDALDFHRSNPVRFTDSVREKRNVVVEQIQSRLEKKESIKSHQASTVNVGPHPTLIHIGQCSLDDVVFAYSSHAQRSYDEPRALSDCPPETDFRIQEAAKQHHLYTLAQAGAMADVESIRQWLRALSPGCVPDVGRGRQSKVLHGP